jgi:hypothetical protein
VHVIYTAQCTASVDHHRANYSNKAGERLRVLATDPNFANCSNVTKLRLGAVHEEARLEKWKQE